MSSPVADPPRCVTVYWRPGCTYCASLRRGLRRSGLVTTEVNIWTDREAAATVRRLAGGNETVPTVVVGDTPLVNPSAAEVLAIVGGSDRPAPSGPGTQGLTVGSMLRFSQWVTVIALVVMSFAVDRAGRPALSWALDGAALAVYLVARAARRRTERRGEL